MAKQIYGGKYDQKGTKKVGKCIFSPQLVKSLHIFPYQFKSGLKCGKKAKTFSHTVRIPLNKTEEGGDKMCISNTHLCIKLMEKFLFEDTPSTADAHVHSTFKSTKLAKEGPE